MWHVKNKLFSGWILRIFTRAQHAETKKRNIIGIPRSELAQQFEELELKSTVEKKVWQWIYARGVQSFEEIPESEIGKLPKVILSQHYDIQYGNLLQHSASQDTTQKWLLQYDPKNSVETVYIPGDSEVQRSDSVEFPIKRKAGTICISSQVGCSVGCSFCFTGTQPVRRNLTPPEMIGQVMTALNTLGEFSKPSEEKNVQTIVFMGQGEPFYNFKNVVKTLDFLSDPEGLCFSRKRMTISTSGVVPIIDKFSENPSLETVQLAISLHSIRDEIRDKLIPLNKQWPIQDLLAACRRYHQKRRILFEYVMLDGVNDHPDDAKLLANEIKDMRAIVNLIPFNQWPGAPYRCSSHERIYEFHSILMQAGINAPIRWPRGSDILAACGQLQSNYQQSATIA